ncbi:hypothetical protein [Bifidobacterium sp.]|uniref:hypothetical protein n=1 Tax=Bifidobacterium sp. TaxID=41200 RepID=UPI0025C671D5|nr:hypothetical protein [Bifidobacterium sp.]MCI1635186.1 hypothetical protein [Bifidobacterium sp.]
MMTRQYAKVAVQIWGDSDFIGLSEQAQALYFKLLTHPTLSLCGVADWRPKRLAALSKGQSARRVTEASRELEDGLYIVTDEDTEEVLIRSFLRNDETLKSPKVAVAVANNYAAVVSPKLRGVIVHEVKRLHEDRPDWSGFSKVENLFSEPEINPIELIENRVSDRVSDTVSPEYPHPLTINHNLQPTTINRRETTKTESDMFDQWYAIYPKKKDPKNARKAFVKALKQTTFEELCDGARRYRDDPNREERYTKYPASWLNAGAWGNEPESPRFNGYVTKAQKAQAEWDEDRRIRAELESEQRGGGRLALTD